MTDHHDLDNLVVNGLERGILATAPPGVLPNAEQLAIRRRRRTRNIAMASGAVVAILAPFLTIAVMSGSDPVSSTSPTTSRGLDPPPCVHSWGDDWVDLESVETFASIEEAVHARTGAGWEMRVVGVGTGGWTDVQVTDPWGRRGVYELAELERGWYVASGQGCAPPARTEAAGGSLQPCGGEWDAPNFAELDGFATPEEAVRALTGDDWELEVQGLESDGWTVVEVTDPWEREGTFYLDKVQDRWVVIAGRGCAPSEGPRPR